jgi:hypothetical protein
MSTGVKQYNLGMNSSMILTIVVALLFQGKSMRDPDSTLPNGSPKRPKPGEW